MYVYVFQSYYFGSVLSWSVFACKNVTIALPKGVAAITQP